MPWEDNAPNDIVKGCVDAINEQEGFDITLLGDCKRIERFLVRISLITGYV